MQTKSATKIYKISYKIFVVLMYVYKESDCPPVSYIFA